MLSDAKGDILELALKVAEKIIGRDLERAPQTIVEICATAIEYARHAKAMVLRVNPKDAAVLREKHKELLDRVGQLAAIAIKEDADVARGGVIIQTDGGVTDAQLSTQLEMLRLVLNSADEGPKEPA
jgi:type III secretion protein L